MIHHHAGSKAGSNASVPRSLRPELPVSDVVAAASAWCSVGGLVMPDTRSMYGKAFIRRPIVSVVYFAMQEYHHVRRIIHLLTYLSSGAWSTSELAQHMELEDPGAGVTIRQIQRDLRSLEQAGVPLRSMRAGKFVRWTIPREYRALSAVTVEQNEVLALHVLKGILGNFHNTRVSKDLERLVRKLERLAPGTVFMADSIVSDVSPGRYATAIDDNVLQQIIVAIIDPHWDRVTYRSIHAGQTKTYVVSFCRLINHAGRLYVAAWHPQYEAYITLAADRIEHVERASDVTDPLHVFSESRYRSGRFGVYDGKVQRIHLRVDANAADFFTSRIWHPSQEARLRRDGSVDLILTAPVSPELVTWIVGWADVLTVKSPKSLISACREKVASIQTW